MCFYHNMIKLKQHKTQQKLIPIFKNLSNVGRFKIAFSKFELSLVSNSDRFYCQVMTMTLTYLSTGKSNSSSFFFFGVFFIDLNVLSESVKC